jgi:hypothetical protein
MRIARFVYFELAVVDRSWYLEISVREKCVKCVKGIHTFLKAWANQKNLTLLSL